MPNPVSGKQKTPSDDTGWVVANWRAALQKVSSGTTRCSQAYSAS